MKGAYMKGYQGKRVQQRARRRAVRRRRRRLVLSSFLFLLMVLTAAGVTMLRSPGKAVSGDGEAESLGAPFSGFKKGADTLIAQVSRAKSSLPGGKNTVAVGTDRAVNSLEKVESVEIEGFGPVEDSYFDDVLFIGDSRTEGLMLYSNLRNATYFAKPGMNVSSVLKTEVKVGKQRFTVEQGLKQKKYGKIYIMLGINELGWPRIENFTSRYRELIAQIQKLQPEAVIVVQSLLPVTAERSDNDTVFNNPKIGRFNQGLADMAGEIGVKYLDVQPAVADQNGALPAESSSDGIHFSKKYCQKWADFLRNYGVNP